MYILPNRRLVLFVFFCSIIQPLGRSVLLFGTPYTSILKNHCAFNPLILSMPRFRGAGRIIDLRQP